MPGLCTARGLFLVAALLLAQVARIAAAFAAEHSSDPDIGFVAVGGESGLGLSEVFIHLFKSKALALRPEVVKASQAPIAAVRTSYGLQEWVDLSELMDFLCNSNQGVCSRARGASVWLLQPAEKAQIPADACNGPRQREAPPTFFCIPDVRMSIGRTFLTRWVNGKEAANLPSIIAGNTMGCTSFDIPCQRLILGRNLSSQAEAYKAARSAGLYDENPPGTAMQPWLKELSGKVVLPAALISVTLPGGDDATVAAPSDRCRAVIKAVLKADEVIRTKRQIDAEYSFIVATDCATVLSNRSSSARPNGMQNHIGVTPAFRKDLTAQIRQAMNLTAMGTSATGHPMIGIWDGVVENRLSLLRPRFPGLTNRKISHAGDYTFFENSVVSWVDPFPTDLIDGQPGGPCGYVNETGHDGDHGTIVAAMIAGETEGLLPGARLWAHQWDRRRYELGKQTGPQDSMDWFNVNIAEARSLGIPPHIANLSCGIDYDLNDELLAWQSMTAHFNGLNSIGVVAPYLVGVAADNRTEETDPISVPMPNPDPTKVGLGGGGYPFLARQYETSGFISVVGLSLSGDDVLKCHDIQGLLARAKAAGATISDPKITNFCPATHEGDSAADQRALVVSGTAFDVGAVGVGVGITQADDGPVVMWGSSFAAPYVTGLAAEIVEKVGDMIANGQVPNDQLPLANVVADRIRFTADRIHQPSVVLYGRINGARALSFETDQFELDKLPDDPADREQDAIFAHECLDQGGHIEVNRDKSKAVMLAPSNVPPLKLDDVLRLRVTNDSNVFEVMYHNPKFRFGPSVVVATLASGGVTLPVQCVGRPNKPKETTRIQLQVVKSFTRCSFGVDQCK